MHAGMWMAVGVVLFLSFSDPLRLIGLSHRIHRISPLRHVSSL